MLIFSQRGAIALSCLRLDLPKNIGHDKKKTTTNKSRLGRFPSD